MENDLAVLDYKTLTPLQNELHHDVAEEDEVFCIFKNEIYKTSWHQRSRRELLREVSLSKKEPVVMFTADLSFHALNYSWLVQYFPAIQVKNRYKDYVRIRWCDYVADNRIERATAIINRKIRGPSFDSVVLDIQRQFFRKRNEDFEKYCKRVGHIASLTTWNTSLPSYKCQSRQPWYYSKNCNQSVPLYLFNQNSELSSFTHEYVFRQLKDLLLMQVKNAADDSWSDVPLQERFIQVSGEITENFFGEYSMTEDTENDFYKCNDDHVTFLADDYVTFYPADNNNNNNHAEEKREIRVQSNLPIRAYWILASQEGAQLSNYLDKNGDNPIECYDLYYGPVQRMKDVYADDEDISIDFHFPSTPFDPGYEFVHSFAWDVNSTDVEVAVVMPASLDARFEIKLKKCIEDVHLVKTIKEEQEEMEEKNASVEQEIEQIKKQPTHHNQDKIKKKDNVKVMLKCLVTRKIQFRKNAASNNFFCVLDEVDETIKK